MVINIHQRHAMALPLTTAKTTTTNCMHEKWNLKYLYKYQCHLAALLLGAVLAFTYSSVCFMCSFESGVPQLSSGMACCLSLERDCSRLLFSCDYLLHYHRFVH